MNGRPVPPESATVSVFDRGFLYGDSIYEVVRTYGGIPFELDLHLTRLGSSADLIGMRVPVSPAALNAEVSTAIAIAAQGELYIRMVITRGGGPIGLDPALATEPVRLIIVQPLNPPTTQQYTEGVHVFIPTVRRNLKAAVDPRAKTGNYLNSVLALGEAKKQGAYEAVMLDHTGLVTEGSSSNVFAVFGDRLVTPPLELGLLAGVTRSVVLDIAADAGLRPLEAPLSEASLIGADEVLLTSTIREILPVVRVNESPVAQGRPGPAYSRLRQAFRAYVDRHNAERSQGRHP